MRTRFARPLSLSGAPERGRCSCSAPTSLLPEGASPSGLHAIVTAAASVRLSLRERRMGSPLRSSVARRAVAESRLGSPMTNTGVRRTSEPRGPEQRGAQDLAEADGRAVRCFAQHRAPVGGRKELADRESTSSTRKRGIPRRSGFAGQIAVQTGTTLEAVVPEAAEAAAVSAAAASEAARAAAAPAPRAFPPVGLLLDSILVAAGDAGEQQGATGVSRGRCGRSWPRRSGGRRGWG